MSEQSLQDLEMQQSDEEQVDDSSTFSLQSKTIITKLPKKKNQLQKHKNQRLRNKSNTNSSSDSEEHSPDIVSSSDNNGDRSIFSIDDYREEQNTSAVKEEEIVMNDDDKLQFDIGDPLMSGVDRLVSNNMDNLRKGYNYY